MLGSAVVYSGLIVAFLGFVCIVKPIRRLRIGTRRRALAVFATGLALAFLGLVLPAPESRIARAETRLDEFAPVWQFHEFHTMRVDAPPDRVYEAIQRVRADEIAFFRALTWIRRGGKPLPESILNAGDRASIIDVATRTGFIYLANDVPRELVVGTVLHAPRGTRGKLTPDVFRKTLPPGFTLASMNFHVRPDGAGSIVSTETRVFANSPRARRRFAAYWRVIYPGSATIRRMWLRAIAKRAES
ncbi:MAG: hypothetical protein M3P06_24880 [Acidobacteriota bacterium]|nr:hypothetical protein [Acidobacteriota bacterium]